MVGKRKNAFLLFLNISVIGYLTLMFRESNANNTIGIFISFKKILMDSEARADILKNIWLFIPFGAILYRLNQKKAVLLIPISLSVLIEGIQYFSKLGFCELDDMICNGLGGWIGFTASRLITDLKLRIRR